MGRRLALSALTTVVLVLAACGNGSSSGAGGTAGAGSSAADKVSVGVIPIVDVAPIYLGTKKGFFAEQKIDPKITLASGGAAVIPGVVSGQFDFGFSNVVSLMVARSKGLPLKAIAEGNSSTGKTGADFGGVVVPTGSTITSAAQLSGKTVAVNNLKNIGDTTVRAAIRAAGGDSTNVKFVELPFPDMPAALANHRVQAAWVVEPFLTVAKNQGAKLIASNLADTAPDLTVAAYFTSEKLLSGRADLAKRFTAAIQKSLEYAQTHPDEVREVLPTYVKIGPDVAKQITLPAWPQHINEKSLQTLADLMLKDGLVSKPVNVADLLQ